MAKILVIGSANVDFITYIDELPNKGETNIGDSFVVKVGGKGVNQAVACARAGGDVAFFGKIGLDANGVMVEKTLRDNRVNLHLLKDSKEVTSRTNILIAKNTKDKQINIVKGANDNITVDDIKGNMNFIRESDIILLQCEIPAEVVKYILLVGYLAHKTVIFNPAPMQEIDYKYLKYATYITPNKNELETLAKVKIHTKEDLILAVETLAKNGLRNIIVTLGDKGTLLYKSNKFHYFPTCQVNVVDTAIADDCFNGTFAACIARRVSILDSIKIATKAATICFTRNGTLESMPTKKEIYENL